MLYNILIYIYYMCYNYMCYVILIIYLYNCYTYDILDILIYNMLYTIYTILYFI